MKKKIEILLSVILVVICVLLASIFNKKDMSIKYTLFFRKDNKIGMYDSFGNKILKEDLKYAGKNNDGYILIVNEENKPAIIDEMGNFIINYDEYDNIEEYGSLYLAYKEDNIFLITRNNKLVRKIENTKELVSKIINSYSVVLFDNIYHIYDSNGNVIKELNYKKKSKISLKETTNYGQVFYENKEYIFSNKTFEITEIETKTVSDMYEFNNVLLLRDETNRVFVENKLEFNSFTCDNPIIEESGIVKCNEDIIYENKKSINEYNVVCDKKCNLLRGKEVLLKDFNEIIIRNTNLNTYFIAKKGKQTLVFNEDLKVKYQTKKSVNVDLNYIEIDNKAYTFEGFEINL
jgi:hypothetical protein